MNLTERDIPLLQSDKWELGAWHASYFKKDRQGGTWQALLPWLGNETLLTFVGPDRVSSNLTREQYNAIF